MYRAVECDWSLVTAPAQEPLSLDDAKLHSSVTQDDENLLIAAYITAARKACEGFLNRALFTQTWKLQLSAFADVVWLPMAAPLQSVTSVVYYDTAGTQTTLSSSNYIVDTTTTPGRIVRAVDVTWPSIQSDRLTGRVVITYVAGWSSVDDIPENLKQGIRLFVAYQNADRIGSADADASRRAAEALWMSEGQVFWRPPECRSF
jgi:uncharacterized phiE125 gp8 family phage protein